MNKGCLWGEMHEHAIVFFDFVAGGYRFKLTCILVIMDKIKSLCQALNGYSKLLILPHNDPDPDAIAAAVGLRYLVKEISGIDVIVHYHGIIGRAENKALVRYLKNPLRRLRNKEICQEVPVALVDTQPGAGNNPLPENIQARIVIDHHAWRETSSQVEFVDVRPEIGASATIITEYLQATDITIPSYLATALFYGIKTDTMGLGRGASPDDAAAYFFLQPKIDVEALVQIERAQVPANYFKSLNAALHAARLYDDIVVSYLGMMKYPDLGAEIADMFWRLKGVKWVVCMGIYHDDLILSVRSRSRKIGAGNLAQHIVGDLGTAGGHGTMAGGQIRFHEQNPRQLAEHLANTALKYIKGDDAITGISLI